MNNTVCTWPRGKVLGGSSAINIMMYIRGQASEYDDWAKIADFPSWRWEELKPFFLKHEGFIEPKPTTSQMAERRAPVYLNEDHGRAGPIRTSFPTWNAPIESLWHEASQKAGPYWKPPTNAWGGCHLGGFTILNAIDRTKGSGTRSYSATGYFIPNAQRKNLLVLTEALAERLILEMDDDGVKVRGLVFTKDGNRHEVRMKRDVILSAGTVQTPQILELSGIGRKKVLSAAGIDCVVESEHVGEHLEDHCLTGMVYDLVDGEFSLDHLTQENLLKEAMATYEKGQGGPLAHSSHVTGFLPVAQVATPEEMKRITEAVQSAIQDEHDASLKEERKILAARLLDPQAASFQVIFFAGSFDATRIHDSKTSFTPAEGCSRASAVICLSHPFSRGSIHIESSDPQTPPRIDPRYLSHPVDVEVLSVGLRVADEVFRTSPLAEKIKGRVYPPPEMDINDSVARERYVRAHLGTEYHPIGTAGLGRVVDERLNVLGVQRLRVADASVFPLHLSGNIVAPVYAVAEKAADIIKQDQVNYLKLNDA